jgi:hypothetical protein
MADCVLHANVNADDEFTFHCAGIVHRRIWSITLIGIALLQAAEQAQHLFTNSQGTVEDEVKALQDLLQQSNSEQLFNLIMNGVLDAADKYEQIRVNCAVSC